MTIGIDGVEPHAEDGWIGGRMRIGEATVAVREHVGRCAVTTLDPDRGVRDLDTLGTIAAYRGDVPTREPLPFGVWCEVVSPGRVAVEDSIELAQP
jgi:MOSC domain-containing protein